MMHRLAVISVISNPVGYLSRYRLYHDFAQRMRDHGVYLITVELATGSQPWAVTLPHRSEHLQLRTNSVLWHKENLVNLGLSRVPNHCDSVAWVDADIAFTNPNWAEDTVLALERYPVVQMFSKAADLDRNGDPMRIFHGFGYEYIQNHGKIPAPRTRHGFIKDNGGIFSGDVFWHPGFAWAARKSVLEQLGGVAEFPILGSADHIMALGLVGQAQRINNIKFSSGYLDAVMRWQHRALSVVGKQLGYVPGMIVHYYHGKKINRGYHTRTGLLIEHQFDPSTDLRKSAEGVLELVTDHPRQQALANSVMKYFQDRREDE